MIYSRRCVASNYQDTVPDPIQPQFLSRERFVVDYESQVPKEKNYLSFTGRIAVHYPKSSIARYRMQRHHGIVDFGMEDGVNSGNILHSVCMISHQPTDSGLPLATRLPKVTDLMHDESTKDSEESDDAPSSARGSETRRTTMTTVIVDRSEQHP